LFKHVFSLWLLKKQSDLSNKLFLKNKWIHLLFFHFWIRIAFTAWIWCSKLYTRK